MALQGAFFKKLGRCSLGSRQSLRARAPEPSIRRRLPKSARSTQTVGPKAATLRTALKVLDMVGGRATSTCYVRSPVFAVPRTGSMSTRRKYMLRSTCPVVRKVGATRCSARAVELLQGQAQEQHAHVRLRRRDVVGKLRWRVQGLSSRETSSNARSLMRHLLSLTMYADPSSGTVDMCCASMWLRKQYCKDARLPSGSLANSANCTRSFLLPSRVAGSKVTILENAPSTFYNTPDTCQALSENSGNAIPSA